LLAPAGGAAVGNEIEKRVRKTRRFDVTVQFRGGGAQANSYAAERAFKTGHKLRLAHCALVPDS